MTTLDELLKELPAIRQRRATITTGEWKVAPSNNFVIRSYYRSGSSHLIAEITNSRDVTFVAAAPKDIDALLALVDALLSERATPRDVAAAPDGDEPGRSYHEHLVATGAAEPDDLLPPDGAR